MVVVGVVFSLVKVFHFGVFQLITFPVVGNNIAVLKNVVVFVSKYHHREIFL